MKSKKDNEAKATNPETMSQEIKEKVLKEILKNGQCPDCSEKVSKCTCDYKELYVTLKINDVKKKAIELTYKYTIDGVLDTFKKIIEKAKNEKMIIKNISPEQLEEFICLGWLKYELKKGILK